MKTIFTNRSSSRPTVAPFAMDALAWVVCGLSMIASDVAAEQLFQLKNGLAIRGTKVELPTLRDGFAAAAAANGHLRPVWQIDDGLRRHYIHGRTMVVGDPVDVAAPGVAIEFPQPRPTGGRTVGALGSILNLSPFNEFGRRRLTIRGPDGSPIEVIQGITQINPRYTKLEALKNNPSLIWDMRIATSSIDSSILNRVFARVVDPRQLDGRLELVRFYTDAERYGDAHRALSDIIADFPDTDDLKPLLVSLVGRSAEQLLDEATRRIDVGQRAIARQILSNFPIGQIGRVMRIRVEEELERLNGEDQKVATILQQLTQQIAQLAAPAREQLDGPIDEIRQHLSAATLSRLADYERLGNSDAVPLENRVSLAISGWLMGAGSGQQNLAIAKSTFRVRNLSVKFLATDDNAERENLLRLIRAEEAGNAETIDRLAKYWRPTHEFLEEQIDAEVEGLFHVDVPGVNALPLDLVAQGGEPQGDRGETIDAVDYHLQLPPQYDPNVSYPLVVALPSGRTPAESEIRWWCGDAVGGTSPVQVSAPEVGDVSGQPNAPEQAGLAEQSAAAANQTRPIKQQRIGHAARNGFIVLAVRWSRPEQRQFEYTAVEHHRVLASLRHAMRRVSIDADRVFLTGHGEGATAAWDIALSHPDLWAGLIAVSAKPEKTVLHYERNARSVSKYIVFGQLDPDAVAGTVLDSYVDARHNALIVMYRGRGRGQFFDEVPRMFQWMRSSSNVRGAIPDEISTATMRTDDRRFWWLELEQINPEIVINPVAWQGRIRAGKVEGSIGAGNLIRFSGPADAFRVHLRPMTGLDFNEPIRLRSGNRTISHQFDGGVETILWDLAARADRARPTFFTIRYPQ